MLSIFSWSPAGSCNPLFSFTALWLYNLRWEKQTSTAINDSVLPEKSTYSVTEIFSIKFQRPSSNYPAFQSILWLASKFVSLKLVFLLFLSTVQSNSNFSWKSGCTNTVVRCAVVCVCVCVFMYFSTSLTLQALPQPWSTHNNSSYGPYKDPPAFYPAHPQKLLSKH